MLLKEPCAAEHWQPLLAEHSVPQKGQQPAARPMAADISEREVKLAIRRACGRASAWGGLNGTTASRNPSRALAGGLPSAAVMLDERKARHCIVSTASHLLVRASTGSWASRKALLLSLCTPLAGACQGSCRAVPEPAPPWACCSTGLAARHVLLSNFRQ